MPLTLVAATGPGETGAPGATAVMAGTPPATTATNGWVWPSANASSAARRDSVLGASATKASGGTATEPPSSTAAGVQWTPGPPALPRKAPSALTSATGNGAV